MTKGGAPRIRSLRSLETHWSPLLWSLTLLKLLNILNSTQSDPDVTRFGVWVSGEWSETLETQFWFLGERIKTLWDFFPGFCVMGNKACGFNGTLVGVWFRVSWPTIHSDISKVCHYWFTLKISWFEPLFCVTFIRLMKSVSADVRSASGEGKVGSDLYDSDIWDCFDGRQHLIWEIRCESLISDLHWHQSLTALTNWL